MVQRGSCLGFALEAGESLRVFGYIVGQELQGYEAAKLHVFGFVNYPHAAAAQLLDDAVVRYGLPDHGLADHSLAIFGDHGLAGHGLAIIVL
jgi:hypothetical protein